MILRKWGDKYFEPTQYTKFIEYHELVPKFLDSGHTSPHRFIKERYADLWKAHKVILRMEGE